MEGYELFLISACAMTMMSLAMDLYQTRKKFDGISCSTEDYRRKERKLVKTILSSPKTSWKKVGSVKEIYYYPLKPRKAKFLEECIFHKYGISTDEAVPFVRDREFLLYDKKSRKFLTRRDYPELKRVVLILLSDNQAKLEAPGMSALIFHLPKIDDHSTRIACNLRWRVIDERVDCNNDTSRWFSEFLTGSKNSISLGIYICDKQRTLRDEDWKYRAEANTFQNNENANLFVDWMSYMIVSEASVDYLNDILKNAIVPKDLRPNIVVEGCKSYEGSWKWIKIGDEAILRNIIPTRFFRRITKDRRKIRKFLEFDELTGLALGTGNNCVLYRAGKVKVGNDIFVYRGDDTPKPDAVQIYSMESTYHGDQETVTLFERKL